MRHVHDCTLATSDSDQPHWQNDGIAEEFTQVRLCTEALCKSLETEDYVVQPAAFVSPPKWHLAHTTWFFDRFILQAFSDLETETGTFNLLFNSYYKSQGKHWLQEARGHLSRPTVQEIYAYRKRITQKVGGLIKAGALSRDQVEILRIGIEHEKQHQELLLMDIKYILAANSQDLAYDEISRAGKNRPRPFSEGWHAFPETTAAFGASDTGFAYDNERPRHSRLLPGFRIAENLVSNRRFLEFIEDGGYERPELWLSDGWDWVAGDGVRHPLYWFRKDGDWFEYHLGGAEKLNPELPVSHVSYYEADAFARWSMARLPTEFELEYFLGWRQHDGEERFSPYWQPGEPVCPLGQKAADRFSNGLLWQWTSSAYSPYPGFKPLPGALSEYNGKFMCNQYVLKGGCVASPRRHLRTSYRNFYRPSDRWAFTGIRLARDPK